MKRFQLATIAATAVCAAAVITSSTMVAAASTKSTASTTAQTTGCSSFTTIQQNAETRLDGRLTVLSNVQARIDAATDLPSSDVATMNADVATAKSGMENLLSEVEAVTDTPGSCAEILSYEATMVNQFRVYMVIAPQIDLSIVSIHEQTVTTKLAGLESSIQTILNDEQQSGKNVTNAEAAFADFKTNVTNSQGSLNNVSVATMLAQTPSDCASITTGDTCSSTVIFKAAYANELQSRTDLEAARTDLSTLISDLN